MKYTDLINAVLSKLGLTEEEAKFDRILDRVPIFANEALRDIANRGKPFYKLYSVNVLTDISGVDTTKTTEYDIVSNTRLVKFPPDFISLTNEHIFRVPIVVVDGIITETDTEANYEYLDGSMFRRYSSRQLLFPAFGYRYYAQAICHYPEVKINSQDLDLEYSIFNLLPDYIASELLKNDDIATAMSYRNAYETALAYLDDTALAPVSSLRNEDY